MRDLLSIITNAVRGLIRTLYVCVLAPGEGLANILRQYRKYSSPFALLEPLATFCRMT